MQTAPQTQVIAQGITTKVALLFLLLIVSLWSCGPQVVYGEQKDLQAGQWALGEKICFPFEITDTTPLYELLLEVTTSEAYKYQNAYVRIRTTFPHQDATEQVLSLELRDESGVPKGICSGTHCVTKIPLQETTYFNAPGAYSLCFEQFMRDSIIHGIERLELSLIRKKEGR